MRHHLDPSAAAYPVMAGGCRHDGAAPPESRNLSALVFAGSSASREAPYLPLPRMPSFFLRGKNAGERTLRTWPEAHQPRIHTSLNTLVKSRRLTWINDKRAANSS
jgi:hypothetical protein